MTTLHAASVTGEGSKRVLVLGDVLRCQCGSDDLLSVAPGSDDELFLGGILHRGVALQCWCARCWPSAMERAA